METKLTICVLFLIYFGALKCADEFEFNFPIGAESICDNGFQLFNKNCYKLMPDNKNFDDSKADCATNSANLSSVHDVETNQFLLYMVKPQNLLLGLKFDDTATVPNYTWADESPYDYRNFPSGYDEYDMRTYLGDCVIIQEDGQWFNKLCSENDARHICQKPATEKPTDVPPTSVPPNKCPTNTWLTGSGTISSPGYPYHYDGTNAALNCSYLLAANTGTTVSVKFTELSNYGTAKSVICLYDGLNDKATQIGNLTGDLYDLPKSFIGTKNTMFMRFISKGQGKWRAVFGPASASTTTTTTTVATAEIEATEATASAIATEEEMTTSES